MNIEDKYIKERIQDRCPPICSTFGQETKSKLLSRLPIFLIFFCSWNIVLAYSGLYSIKDLEVLEQEKNYKEFLIHAYDIRPSERKKHWQEMVINMAEGYIEYQLKKKKFDQKSFNFIESISMWPILRNDEIFHLKRGIYGYKYLKLCLEKKIVASLNNLCIKQLQNFWSNTHKNIINIELGIKLGTLLEKYQPNIDLWPFFKMATVGDAAEFHCQKKPVQRALIKRLIAVIDKNNSEVQLIKEMDGLARPVCLSKLIPSLKSSLNSPSSQISSYAYILLKAKNNISLLERELFLIRYILNGPVVGNIFNEAWNSLVRLGQNHKKRMEILSKLKKFDPLPDKLFSILDQKKKKDFIRITL